MSNIYLLVYGSIITPVFEETLFRGILWKEFEKNGVKSSLIFFAITLLFGFWHLGYIDSIAWRINGQNLGFVMMMKVLTGIAVGILTGISRKKNGGIYYSILVHAVWNVFAK